MPPPPGRPPGGVLSALRESVETLERLAREYETASAEEPRRRELYERYAADCARDARTVRRLVERAMR